MIHNKHITSVRWGCVALKEVLLGELGNPGLAASMHPKLHAAAAKLLQSCPTLCDPIEWQPTRLPRPWDSPGKNTGVGCHFLLQCRKVKSESEVAQSCPTLSDPVDCNVPGSSTHGIFQARTLEPKKQTRGLFYRNGIWRNQEALTSK